MRKVSIFAGALLVFAAGQATAADTPVCAKPGALGVARTVEIDTTGGPGFGLEHYKAYDFLQPKEVVLTFDDGPQKFSTEAILDALAAECVKATFFSVGKMALGYPEILRAVVKAGHTVGSHTWSHKTLPTLKTFAEQKDEIERGVSAVRRAAGGPVAPFFRFPTLKDTPEAVAHLGSRNIAMFSTDIDSFDFKPQPAEKIVKTVLAKLEKNGKGIVLMHDIHKTTAKAVPLLLAELKLKGFKIVHVRAKAPSVTTVAEYDAAIEKDAKGLPQAGAEKSIAAIVKTVEGEPAPDEVAKTADPVQDGAKHEAEDQTAAEEQSPAPSTVSSTSAPQQPATMAVTEPAKLEAAANSAPTPAASASPVSTVTTGTIDRATAQSAGEGGTAHDEPAATPDKPALSFMDKARQVWELWFGK